MNPLLDTRLAVFGPGLLGGSLLHDARALGARELRVWARREESLTAVREGGLADFTGTDPAQVAEGADLLILCVPVGGMRELADRLAASRPAREAVFTDVGSVKGMVMRDVAPVLISAGFAFIGSHPMAGSEKAGLSAARAGLYRNAACILTPPPQAPPAALEKLHAFWHALGCRTSEMDAAAHDAVVARISHVPHVAAVLAALTAFRPDAAASQYAAGGLRDTTRVASGDPAMWREILMENREALLPALRDLRNAAGEIISALESGDGALLQSRLEEARHLRATRYS
jgi:prephenate dehydrogenase